ncbi:glycerophosphodiester phosphodiesterase [Pseudactinotalea sp. Z1748]|uniref:glycerophosphodiester phosphodiesterase n=1 Tax=Pseudactinotalea sp. Z1748 TaxID=3413027 RepID=UPI003C7EAF75
MAHEPENSLASFALAEAVGADEIELDVRLSSDRELVLVHDETLDRIAADGAARGLGPVSALTLAQLQSVTLGSGRGVVTLEEMYEATRVRIQLEIKDPAVTPHLAQYYASRPQHARRTIVASFCADVTRAVADLIPGTGRQLIMEAIAGVQHHAGGLWGALEHARATRLACGFAGVTPRLVEQLRAAGLEVHLWPVRTLDDIREAIGVGANGVTSDDPARAIAWREQVLAEG